MWETADLRFCPFLGSPWKPRCAHLGIFQGGICKDRISDPSTRVRSWVDAEFCQEGAVAAHKLRPSPTLWWLEAETLPGTAPYFRLPIRHACLHPVRKQEMPLNHDLCSGPKATSQEAPLPGFQCLGFFGGAVDSKNSFVFLHLCLTVVHCA